MDLFKAQYWITNFYLPIRKIHQCAWFYFKKRSWIVKSEGAKGATEQVSGVDAFIGFGVLSKQGSGSSSHFGFNGVDVKLTQTCGCSGWCPGHLPARTQSARSATLTACGLSIQSVHTADTRGKELSSKQIKHSTSAGFIIDTSCNLFIEIWSLFRDSFTFLRSNLKVFINIISI